MANDLLTVVISAGTTVITMGVIHVARTMGNPLRFRREPAPLDLSQYRVKE